MAEINEIEAAELKRRLDRGDTIKVLDVREPGEIAIAAFPNATCVPMGEIPARIAELNPEGEWVVVCHHGMRSAQVATYLARNGFEHVANLNGGIDQWSLTVDPAVPRY